MAQDRVDKRVGGVKRAKKAREYMRAVMADEGHQMRYAKDIDFARKFDVSRHTIYAIRDELKMPPRSQRVADRLKRMKTADRTLGEICQLLNVKYAGLYKVMTENGIPFKSDLKPPVKRKRATK